MDAETLPDFTVRHGVDLTECLEDSPDFREHLEGHEKEIGDLESGIERMVQLCGGMVSAGHKYKQACRDFGAHIKEMAGHFTSNEKVAEMLKTTSDLFSELSSYFSVLFDQVQRSVQNALKNFLVCEIGKLRESKRSFDRISDEYNTALHKNAQAPKSKPLEADEATKFLQVTSVAFSVVAMDHVYQINCLQSKKGYEVLEKVASMLRAQLRFFSDGCERLKKFEPVIEQMGTEIDAMKKEAIKEVKKMEGRHSLVKKLRSSPDSKEKLISSPPLSASSSDNDENIGLKGYLFKRGSSKFKMWNRRYFVMKDNQLQYQKKGPTKETHVVAEDLRLCAVKNVQDMERRFCFEIVAPTKSFLLQADSEVIRRKWMAAIQASIATAFRQTMTMSTAAGDGDVIKRSPITTTTTDPARVIRRLARVAGNDRCADCGDINPSWSSINLGVLLCIECSGIHRSLGVHISKVRSVTLDAWESEVLRVMTKLGNRMANTILEYEVPEGVVKPIANSTRAEKEKWISAKYVQHSFVHPHTSVPDIQTTTCNSPLSSSIEQSLTINKPLVSHCEDMLADDSAPESEYDTKSLKRKKKQNKIRRWAMDKLVKRGIAKDASTVVKETPSIVSEGDDISITSRDVPSARTLPLRERKATYSVGELPPPKPPRTKKIKSLIMETSVTEPLLSSEDPVSEEWYKSGSLFETDFCDSIMEVIKNIGYTCDSPSSSMMQSDGEAPSTDNSTLREKNRCDDVIANGNILESPISKTSAAEAQDLTDGPVDKALTIETRNLSETNQSDDRFNEEIPDEFQRYNGDDKATESILVLDDPSLSLPAPVTKVLREKSISASDVSLEFFSAHSSPINSIDNCGSPMHEATDPVMVSKKPAKKLETTASVSEESSNEGNSSTNLLGDSSPLSKSPMANVTSHGSTDDTHAVTRNSPNVEISEAGGVTKDSEPCSSTPGEPDTGPSYTVVKTNIDTDVSSSTLVAGNASTEEVTSLNLDVTSSNLEVTSSNQEAKLSNQEMTSLNQEMTLSNPEVTSSNPEVASSNQNPEVTSSNPKVPSPVTSAINDDTTSPMTSSTLVLPGAASGDPFTSDEELDDNGRPSSAPEPIIIPLSKTAHEFLYSSAKKGSLPGMLCALAHGANVNFMNPTEELKCPLIASILAESLESTEFLLQNGAKLHLRDSRGRGCLHHAASIGAVGHVCLLLKRGTIAHLHSVDEMGKDALDIAEEQGNADIVTLLRLAKLNDSGETVDERQNKTLQETVSLVYRDIKHSTSIDSPTMPNPPPVEIAPVNNTCTDNN